MLNRKRSTHVIRKLWLGVLLAAGMLCSCSENSSEQTASAPLTAPMVNQNAADVATDPSNAIYSTEETTFSEAYVGAGYWLARTDENGNLSQLTDVYHYPVIGDDDMVSVLTGHVQDDGMWSWGAAVSYADALNNLLAKGGKYALVAGDDILYAVGEDDSVTVLSKINGMDYPDFTCTFAEASMFGNVVSQDSISVKAKT